MIKLVQISDCHLYAEASKIQYSIAPYFSLSQVFEQVQQVQPDIVLVTGDISADETLKSYQHFLELWEMANINCQIKLIPGNHDDWQCAQSVLGAQASLIQSPIKQKFWQIHGLNSQIAGSGEGWVETQQIDSLCESLAQYPETNHIVAVHHHPIELNSWANKYLWKNRQYCLDRLVKFSNVKAILFGHLHKVVDQYLNQIALLGCPSTCWQFKHELEFAIDPQASAGFRLLTLHDNGEMRSQIINVKET